MVQLKIAFLDEEEVYLEQLNGYLVRKNETFFKVWTFSEAEAFLKEAAEKTVFDAVVMTAPFWEKVGGYTAGAKKILLCEGAREKAFADCPYAAKYQSAEKLFGQISAMLWQEEAKEEVLPERSAEMIGIYSPVHHENQMLFSITMAQILGESQNVLYVSLMEHSGFYRLMHLDAAEDIGDFLYAMMQKEHDFAAGLHRVRQTWKNFDFIPPAVNPEHLSEISKPLFEQLLMMLKNRSGYDTVIVDFGTVFLGFAEILPVFGSFYCLGKEGTVNRYRTEEFFEYLGRESGHMAAHINRLLLPEEIMFSKDANPIESSLYGGMGDYIRRCLYGGVQIG